MIELLRSPNGRTFAATCAAGAVLLAGAAWWLAPSSVKAADTAGGAPKTAPAKAALTVTTTSPTRGDWPTRLSANGNIAAWQEAVVGAEIGGLRLSEVLVNVGDRVRRGQVLARMQADTVAADVAQSKANLAEAQASLAEAQANADRARQLQATGAISAQQIAQYETGAQTAQARVEALKARLHADEVRLAQTAVKAPDDGVISARAATVGAVLQPGQELFRLIRKERLEWRAEVTASDLDRVKPGMAASIVTPSGKRVAGKVRMVAPTVDPQTRNGMVYVDIATDAAARADARAGMFARGEFDLGRAAALSLPQSAVLLRDGFSYVYRVGADNRVTQTKVGVGRRQGDRIEITSGIDASARVVASGVGFLADGDTVLVVQAPPAGAAPASAPSAS